MASIEPPTDRQKVRIREKLADGTLPWTVLAAEVTLIPGRARVAPCDACDEIGMTRPIAGQLWHEGCFRFWRAETSR